MIIISVLFGFSGFAALTYQVTWIRELGSFFGIQVYATATVLTSFMAGLALGSWLFGRWVDRMAKPLLLFAVMEIILAVYAVSFPWIVDFIGNLYLQLAPANEGRILLSQFARFAVTFPVLLVATSLMGGTLPVLARAVTQKQVQLGGNISLLYGSNNLGAFLGGFFSGYIFLATIGISGALLVGCALNLVNAGVVFMLNSTPVPEDGSPKPAPGTQHYSAKRLMSSVNLGSAYTYPSRVTRIVLWVFAIEGFTTLAYEIIWARIMHEFSYDKTSFFYTTVILAFVGGLAIGSYIVKGPLKRGKDPLKLLARVQIGIGCTTLLLFVLFILTAPLFHAFQESQSAWFATVGLEQFYIFLVITPPVVLMGFTFPLVSVIYNHAEGNIGKDIGSLGALDTVGSVAGSVVAAFVLIPLLGTVRSFLAVVMINLLLGTWLLQFRKNGIMMKRLAGVLVVAIVGLVALLPANTVWINKQWNTVLEDKVIYYREGPSASVGVTEFRNRNAALSINGAITAYTLLNDVQVHKMLGVLPWIFTEEPGDALVVGLGIGITAKTLDMAGVPDISVAEISPEVAYVCENIFGTLYFQADSSPAIFIEDGRAHLYRSEKTYDLITTNAIHPRLGNGIYTSDFYAMCADRMSPDGIMCQWIPTNWLSEEEYKTLLRSFTAVFPCASLWVINDAHTIVLGSGKPFRYDLEKIMARLREPAINEYLERSLYINSADVLKHFWLDNAALKDYIGPGELNTDNRPVIEFSKVVSRAPNLDVLTSFAGNQVRVGELFETGHDRMNVLNAIESRQQELANRLGVYIEQID